MKNIRVIPLLHIKGPNVVKPVHSEALRIVGNPKELAFRYFEEGADEIIYMDIVASLYRRSIDFELLKSVSEDIYIPFTVGGGIRSLQDINNVLRSGADKVAINTYAVSNGDFISKAAKEFGSQCIVLSIDAKRQPNGTWEAYTDGGRERSNKDATLWAKQGIELGAGEILISSIDQDGTRRGYDLELINKITSFAKVPVIVHGGARDLKSILEVIVKGKVDGVAASTIFHYNDFPIMNVKEFLNGNNINVRDI